MPLTCVRVSGARGRKVFQNGEPEAGIWSAGLAQGLIDDIPTVRDLVHRIVAEADAPISGRLAAVCGA